MPVPLNNSSVSASPTPEVTPAEDGVTPSAVVESTSGVKSVQMKNKIRGLSSAELDNPNSIGVVVSDPDSPLVVLFGPPACGKTMTLVRLARFLRSEGYTVAPIRTFRPISDVNYVSICDGFDEMINSDNAAESTRHISFMLVEVIKNGRRLCQILEAPGEFYFNPQEPSAAFPNYVNTIINSSNRKIWTIMVEPDWLDDVDRRNYANKVRSLKANMRLKDRVVFVFNKIDKTNYVRSVGNINVSESVKAVQNLYPNIFIPFMNEHPITKLWKPYLCDFVPFQTGTYTPAFKGITYQEGAVEYCVRLWRILMKRIAG